MGPFGLPVSATARFSVATLALFAIPGSVILGLAGRGLNRLERFSLSIPVGLWALGSAYYLLDVELSARPGLPGLRAFLIGWAAAFLVAWLLLKVVDTGRSTRIRRVSPLGKHLSIGLVVACVLPILAKAAFVNGELTDRGVFFALDDFSHFSLMGEFMRPGPTLGPYLAGFPFPPHNLLNAALAGALLTAAPIDPVRLFCSYLPALYFGLTALVGYAAFRRLSRSHTIALFSAFLLFYSGDYILPIAMADEPHNGLVVVLLLGGLGLLTVAVSRRSWRLSLLAGLLFGGTFQAKAPVFVTIVVALGIHGVLRWLRSRRGESIIAAVAAFGYCLLFALPHLGELQQSTFRFAPGETFIEYVATWSKDVPAVAPVVGWLGSHRLLAFVISVAVLLLASLNVRLVSLPMLWRRIRERRPLTVLDGFLASLFLVGLCLSLTVLNPNAHGSVVPFFFYYYCVIPVATLPAAWALVEWSKRTTRRRAWAGLAAFLVPTVALGVGLFTGEDERESFSLPVYRMAVYLREHTQPTDVILHDPKVVGLCWFSLRPSVLANQPVLQGEGDLINVGEAYRKRLFEEVARRREDIARFLETEDPAEARSILDRYGARYVAVLPERGVHFATRGVLERAFADPSGGTVFRVLPGTIPPGA